MKGVTDDFFFCNTTESRLQKKQNNVIVASLPYYFSFKQF